MTTKTVDKTATSERSPVARRVSSKSGKYSRVQAATATKARKRAETPEQQSSQAPTTKHAQLIRLLSSPEGASIEDLMRATNWQQHSVRGFLAGTVKKKMGLALTSSKVEGEPRLYKIAARRGR